MTLVGLAVVSGLLLQQPLTLPPQSTATPTVGTAEVRGRVIGEPAGAAVAGVIVRLTLLSPSPSTPKTATTDEAGRFVVTGLPAGQYSVTVVKGGVVITAFGTNGGVTRTTTVDVADGAKRSLADLRIVSGVAISGLVLDDKGNPLKGATVSAWRLIYLSPGERRLSFSGQATSDEIGDYRIDGLKPGSYYVDAKASESIAPTYFPETANARSASVVQVSTDIGAAGINIRLLSIPLAKVSGTVINSQGVSSSGFSVFLSPVRDDGAQVGSARLSAEVDAAGKFVIDKVPPGAYIAGAVANSRLEKISATGRPAEGIEGTESGGTNVTVDGTNLDDVVIATTPLTNVSGKFTLDGKPLPAGLAKGLMVQSATRSGPGGMYSLLEMTYGAVAEEGTFTMPIVPGGRLLRVQGLPAGTVLQRILVFGNDVTDEGFDVGNSEIREAVIALTSTPSHVGGRVLDDRGAPVANAGVIVFSADARFWKVVGPRMVQSTKSGREGTFEFTGLPAGHYLAVALPVLTDGEWAEPSNLERLRAAATSLTLTDGERKELTLTVKKAGS